MASLHTPLSFYLEKVAAPQACLNSRTVLAVSKCVDYLLSEVLASSGLASSSLAGDSDALTSSITAGVSAET